MVSINERIRTESIVVGNAIRRGSKTQLLVSADALHKMADELERMATVWDRKS